MKRDRLLVPLYFVLLTIGFTWPAVLHLTDSVVGQLGDNLHFAWLMGWFDQALLEDFRWPFLAPHLNYPEGWHLARSETTPLQMLLGLPFAEFGGPLLAYNLVALASFAVSGLTAYYWVRELTQDRLAGLISGTLFAFLPFRFAHYRVGHLNILGTMWFPLFFLSVLKVLHQGSATRREAVFGGLSLGLIALTSQYFLYVTLITTAIAGLLYLIFFKRSLLRSENFWKAVGLMLLVAVPVVLMASLPYFQLAAEESIPNRGLQSVATGSASVSDFLLPSTDHFLLGTWVGERFARDHWVEGTLYVGAVGLGLSLLALWRSDQRAQVRFLLILFFVAAVLALGTHLYWNEQQVRFELPSALASLLDREDASVPMPGYFLFQYLPFYAKMRTFKRVGAIALLAVSMLAGLGAAWLLKRTGPRRRNLVGAGLLMLAVIDFYPGPIKEFSAVEPRAVDLWLSEQPGLGAVVEFPFYLQEEQAHVYYSLIHGKPIMGGFFNAFPPPQYRRLQPIMATFPDKPSIETLKDLSIEYIVIASDAYPDPHQAISDVEDFGLVLAASFEDTYVFVWSDP